MDSSELIDVPGDTNHLKLFKLTHILNHIWQRHLQMKSEQHQLEQLNEHVSVLYGRLSRTSWLVSWDCKNTCWNRNAYDNSNCNVDNLLRGTRFVDAQTILNAREYSAYCSILQLLRSNPRTLAQFLASACVNDSSDVQRVSRCVVNGIFGCCVLPYDESALVKTLIHLYEFLLLSLSTQQSVEQIKWLSGNGIFAQLYSDLLDSLPATTVFLISALRPVVTAVIQEDEKFYEIETEKILARFPPVERVRIFGNEGSAEYNSQLSGYRARSLDKLTSLCKMLLRDVNEHLFLLPANVKLLINSVARLRQKTNATPNMVLSSYVDMLFSWLICPALINPEKRGVAPEDAFLSAVARYNLSQVANVIQRLTTPRQEQLPTGESPMAELLSKFQPDCISKIVATLKAESDNGSDSMGELGHRIASGGGDDTTNCNLSPFIANATSCYFTSSHLRILSQRLKAYFESENIAEGSSTLIGLLSQLSSEEVPKTTEAPIGKSSRSRRILGKAASITGLSSTPPEHDKSEDGRSQPLATLFEDTVLEFTIPHLSATTASIANTVDEEDDDNGSLSSSNQCDSSSGGSDCFVDMADGEPVGTDDVVSAAATELAQLRVVNGSAEYGDNLSDMTSANVSGRGSPTYNISGRGSPSSQVTDNFAGNEEDDASSPEVSLSSSVVGGDSGGGGGRGGMADGNVGGCFDIDEKFGKFEIKGMGNNRGERSSETRSIISSETWSTEVMASDCGDQSSSVDSEAAMLSAYLSSQPSTPTTLDYLATVNESKAPSEGWSTDVAPSESERSVSSGGTTGAPQDQSDDFEMVGGASVSFAEEVERLEPRISDEDGNSQPGPSDLRSGPTTSSPAHQSGASTSSPFGLFKSSISFNKADGLVAFSAVGDKIKKGFFRNFKQSLKNGRNKFSKTENGGWLPGLGKRQNETKTKAEEEKPELPALLYGDTDSVEDILEKYRRVLPADGTDSSKPSVSEVIAVQPTTSPTPSDSVASRKLLEESATRKLVALLLKCDNLIWPQMEGRRRQWREEVVGDNSLVALLHTQLANVSYLGEESRLSHRVQLQETLRCIRMLDASQCCAVLENIRNDCVAQLNSQLDTLRSYHRCILLNCAALERSIKRTLRQHQIAKRSSAITYMRDLLHKEQTKFAQFVCEFEALHLGDEKNASLTAFLQNTMSTEGLSGEHFELALERAVLSTVYYSALYPNGEGDRARDGVLQEHLEKLSEVVTVDHKDIRVPFKYRTEAPWLAAQDELRRMAVCRAARDKLRCVLRCMETILNLLMMADNKTPSADDLVPILIFVIIKAKPSALLSTIEYVNSFYGRQLSGESHYWWVQFCSAVEYVKTMDY